jgi:hypothetical protein
MDLNDPRRELIDIVKKGRHQVRRARIVAFVVVGALVGHLEWLVLPCAQSAGGFAGLLVLAYPVMLGGLALSALFGAIRPIDMRSHQQN